mgnify:CR=1 FL=1
MPLCTAKEVAPVAVKVCVGSAAVPEKVPNEPEAVTHAGASDTFKNAEEDLQANPSVTFSTLI